MKLSVLKSALEAVCPRVAYRAFKTDTPTPFICYLFTNDDDVFADDANYAQIAEIDIELYSDDKNPRLERQLQEKLAQLELSWAKAETWIDSEKFLQVVYTVQILIEPEDETEG